MQGPDNHKFDCTAKDVANGGGHGAIISRDVLTLCELAEEGKLSKGGKPLPQKIKDACAGKVDHLLCLLCISGALPDLAPFLEEAVAEKQTGIAHALILGGAEASKDQIAAIKAEEARMDALPKYEWVNQLPLYVVERQLALDYIVAAGRSEMSTRQALKEKLGVGSVETDKKQADKHAAHEARKEMKAGERAEKVAAAEAAFLNREKMLYQIWPKDWLDVRMNPPTAGPIEVLDVPDKSASLFGTVKPGGCVAVTQVKDDYVRVTCAIDGQKCVGGVASEQSASLS